MIATTPTEADMIGKIKEKQRVLLREFQEKPAAGRSAAPGGNKTVTPVVVKRVASKTPTTTVRTPKTYAAATASTPTATPTSSTSKSAGNRIRGAGRRRRRRRPRLARVHEESCPREVCAPVRRKNRRRGDLQDLHSLQRLEGRVPEAPLDRVDGHRCHVSIFGQYSRIVQYVDKRPLYSRIVQRIDETM